MAKAAQLHDNINRTRNVVLRRDNLLGRAPECGIHVDNNIVSRHHAHIACAPGTTAYYIEDVSARGTYVNFRRIKGRFPLKEGDRICVLRFHNVHPGDLAKMGPEQLKECADDPRVEGIKPVADFTFGYVEVQDAQPQSPETRPDAKPPGLLARLKGLFGGK